MSDDFWTALENYEDEPFDHLPGCPGGPLSVSFGGTRSCMWCLVANAAYEQGQRDMLAEVISELERMIEEWPAWSSLSDALAALRALGGNDE